MPLTAWNLEAIDRAIREAIADPHADPQAQADRIDYLLERRFRATTRTE